MNKKQMSEQDIRTKYITPAILAAGWDRDLQIREEVSFTKGKITVRRKIVKRGEQKRADYILYWKPNIPLAIVEAKDNTPIEDIPQDEVPEEDGQEIPPDVTFGPDDDTPKRVKYYVNDVPVSIINERVQYLDADGKLITESLVDYTRKNIRKEYATLDEFLQRWNSAQKKTAIVEELEQKGIFFEELREEISKDLDPFDLICHIAFDMPPLTRKERANNVKKRGYFGKYNEVAKQVLEALLDKYADEGLANLESMEVLKVPDVARFGTPVEILKCFGNKKKFMEAIAELENQLYVA